MTTPLPPPSEPTPSLRSLGWFDLAPSLASLILGFQVLRGFAARLHHPFDLEWMEGGMLAHAWRITHGLPLYPEPEADWIPYVYPPGYSGLLAAISTVAGLEYGVGRAVSIVGTLAAAGALVGLFARRGQSAVGLAVAACFLGCWRASGAFYDLVRPDGLAIGLLAWSLLFALERHRRAPLLSGLLLFVAFAVKHHSAAFGIPIVLGLWLRDGLRSALSFTLASAVPALLFVGAAELGTSGRFLEYLLLVPASHPLDERRMIPGTPGELGAWLLPAMIATTAALWAGLRRHRSELPAVATAVLPSLLALGAGAFLVRDPVVRGVAMPSLPVLGASGACIGAGLGLGLTHLVAALADRVSGAPQRPAASWWTAWLLGGTALVVVTWMRGHNGGFLNVLMPAHFAICAGLGFAVLEARRTAPSTALHAATSLVLLVQIGWIFRQLDVDEVLPTEEDRVAGEAIVERLRACPEGPILSPYAAWLPVQAGRAPSPHLIAIWDIDHDSGPFHDGMRRLKQASHDHVWPCVVKGGGQATGFGLDTNYRRVESFSLPGRAMMPKTGWRVRPSELWMPRETP